MNVVIFGSSGHAKVVHEIILLENKYSLIGFVDHKTDIKSLHGLEIITDNFDQKLVDEHEIEGGIIGIGENSLRSSVCDDILKKVPNFTFINAIHPKAVLPKDISLGLGNAVMAGAVINSSTKILNHCIVNTNSSIDHDCILGNFSSIAPGCAVGGNVSIGNFSSIGIGASLKHGITIADNCIIGGKSFVDKNTLSNSVYYGVPAKKIRKHNFGESYL